MRTAETQIVEIVETKVNSESLNGIMAGAGLMLAGASIAMLTGGMTVDFPEGAKGLVPMLGILIGVSALFYFFMQAHIVSVMKTSKQVPVLQPQRSSKPEAPLEAEIKEAATEQTAVGGDETKPNAVRPQQPPRSDQRDDRGGGKGRGSNGSSQAPHDGKPGSGKPDDKKTPAGA